MDTKDYYKTLGVARDADDATLKSAYRKQAMRYHPDRNPGDKEAERRFKEVSEAYEVLKDAEKRAFYDRIGHDAFQNGGAASGRGGFDDLSNVFDQVFGDLNDLMGGSGRRGGGPRHTRGADLRYDLEISLEDAFHGRNVSIAVSTSVTCGRCHGSGAADGAKPKPCGVCHGRGKVRSQQGFFTLERACSACHGQGEIIESPCKACEGQGRVEKEKKLSVAIPRGVDDGARVRLAGEGEAGVRGGAAGDLYIFMHVKPHALFRREGPNTFCQVPLSMADAALGAEIEVPTIEGGRTRVRIPAGAQNGQRLRLRGKGMKPLQRSERGDMIIELNVETPVRLSKRQRELLEEFRAASGEASHYPQSEGFLGKVKEFWDNLTAS